MDPVAAWVLVPVIAFFGWIAYSHWAATRISGHSAKALEAQFPGLSQRSRALVFCYGPSCPPCQAMHPDVQALARENDSVYELDISTHLDMARKLGIRATPTLLLIEQGVIAKVVIGQKSLNYMRALLAG